MPDSARRLAVLIAAPMRGEDAMHSDVQSIHEALRRRGLPPEDLLVLEGRLDRGLLLGVLGAVRSRAAGWAVGEVFLYYSGHGAFAPPDAADAGTAEPAIVFAREELEMPERWLFWREIFAALALSLSVRLTALPDC